MSWSGCAGWAMPLDDEENELGVRCIAAAIPDYRGRASYAVSVSAPISRMSDERIGLLRGPLLQACDEIAAALGGSMSRGINRLRLRQSPQKGHGNRSE